MVIVIERSTIIVDNGEASYGEDMEGTILFDDNGNPVDVDNVFDEIERKMKELGVE